MRSLCAIVVTLVLCVLGTPPITGQEDMTIAELRELYGRRVLVAEKLVRVKQNMPSWMPTIYVNSHSGVRVTLEGTPHQYLIHKGPENSESEYKSVITDARNMRSGWQLKSTKYYNGRVTVQDLINAAGGSYNVFISNCHQAADAMMGL